MSTKMGVLITSVAPGSIKGALVTFSGEGLPIVVAGSAFSVADVDELKTTLDTDLEAEFPENEPA